MLQSGHCVVLGGGGFIGSHVAEALLAHGYSVSVFGRRNSKKTNLLHLFGPCLHFILSVARCLLHQMITRFMDVEVNLIGTIQLLKLCATHKVKGDYDLRCYR